MILFLLHGAGFPAYCKNCACGCDKTDTDETNGMKMFASEQKPADARPDRLSDVKQRRIERDGCAREIRRGCNESSLLQRIHGGKSEPPEKDACAHGRQPADAGCPQGHSEQYGAKK